MILKKKNECMVIDFPTVPVQIPIKTQNPQFQYANKNMRKQWDFNEKSSIKIYVIYLFIDVTRYGCMGFIKVSLCFRMQN